jgi:hypothetical protein
VRDEQRERLGVSDDPQRAGVHRIETHVADQLRGQPLETVAWIGKNSSDEGYRTLAGAVDLR